MEKATWGGVFSTFFIGVIGVSIPLEGTFDSMPQGKYDNEVS